MLASSFKFLMVCGLMALTVGSICGADAGPAPADSSTVLLWCCSDTDSDAPAAAGQPPAPAPPAPGCIVRGHVTLSGALGLQKPDLTRVVIYLTSDAVLDAMPSGIDHATVAQRNKSFVPNFAVVPQGTVVEFPNWDDFDHNVFSRSKAAPAFDLDRYPRGQSKSRVFEKVGVVQVFCNIHPEMRAIVFVTPNRFFARAEADGSFTLTDVPPGRHEITAWHERCGEQQAQIVQVEPDAAPEVTFALEENRNEIIANNPPKRESGYGVERGLGVKRERLDLPVVKDSHPAPNEPK